MVSSLRKLQIKDAPLMLEWMHDPEIQRCFQRDMMKMTLSEAESFCMISLDEDSPKEGDSFHYAIVNENDEYLGTISLKNLNLENQTAEYAISMRCCVHGKGVAKTATALLLQKGFKDFGLHKIYLNVLANNLRAIRYYEKCGFVYEGEFREHINQEGKYVSLRWYGMLENEFSELISKDGIEDKIGDGGGGA